MKMKNFIFKSSNDNSDLLKIFVSLEIIKKQNRALRDDCSDLKSRLTQLARLTTDHTIDEEYPEEEIASKDIPGGS